MKATEGTLARERFTTTILAMGVLLAAGGAGCKGRAAPAAGTRAAGTTRPAAATEPTAATEPAVYVPADPKWHKDYPAEFSTWTCESNDGKFRVTTVWHLPEKARHVAGAHQFCFHMEGCRPDIIATWGPDGPYAVTYPIFRHAIRVSDGLYLALGWTANNVTDVQLYAYLVKADHGRMHVGAIYLWARHGERFLLRDARLGLFVPDFARRDWPWEISVIGRRITPKEFAAEAKAPPPRTEGLWFTRPALEGADPGKGKVYWIDLKDAAKKIPADAHDLPADDLPH